MKHLTATAQMTSDKATVSFKILFAVASLLFLSGCPPGMIAAQVISPVISGLSGLTDRDGLAPSKRSAGFKFKTSADTDKGISAYVNGDYATALRELTPLAEQGFAPCPVSSGCDVRVRRRCSRG
jgi:hypothetical protein